MKSIKTKSRTIVQTAAESTHLGLIFYMPVDGLDPLNPPQTVDHRAILDLVVYPTEKFSYEKDCVNLPLAIQGVCAGLNLEGLPVVLGVNLFCCFVYLKIVMEEEELKENPIPKPLKDKDKDKEALDWFNSAKPKDLNDN